MKPIVFAYNILETKFGLFGNSLLSHIEKVFKEEGCEFSFLPIRNGAVSTLETRGEQIARQLHNIGDCHLVGFSVAGLDCRLALDQITSPVSSLTTIASPHHGSYFAHWGSSRAADESIVVPLVSFLGIPVEALPQITPRSIKKINQKFHSDLKIFTISSWKDYEQCSDLVRNSYTELTRHFDYFSSFNDGVFGVHECQWGDHLLSFDADHTELLGNNFYRFEPIYHLVIDNIKEIKLKS